jgi:hypothetical protein
MPVRHGCDKGLRSFRKRLHCDRSTPATGAGGFSLHSVELLDYHISGLSVATTSLCWFPDASRLVHLMQMRACTRHRLPRIWAEFQHGPHLRKLDLILRWLAKKKPAPLVVPAAAPIVLSTVPPEGSVSVTVPQKATEPISVGAASALAGRALANADLAALEAEMLQFLSWRIAELGADGSGLGTYYAHQIGAGRVFNDGDTMLLNVLPYNFHDYEWVVEAGAGFGQLGLALGVLGRKTVCIEADSGRHACMAALKAWLETKYIDLAKNVTLLHGTWPHALGVADPSRALLVACDFVYTGTGDSEGQAIEALKAYGGAVIDASHFALTRLTPAARLTFYTRLADAGIPVPAKLPPHRNNRESEFIFVCASGQD